MDKNQKRYRDYIKMESLKEAALFLADILYNALIIVFLVIIIRSFLISPFRIIGSSMSDTLSNSEFILIDKLSYYLGEPKRGDPVVFLPPITNKYPHKFEENVKTDMTGAGILPIGGLAAAKQIFYCKNSLVRKLWICKDKVKENDMVYFRPKNGGAYSLSWKNASAQTVTPEEVRRNELIIKGSPNHDYIVRIYNSAGPEYFVKRIIGVPGDTIVIENGRVYLKKTESSGFAELSENYLNDENRYNTYFRKTADTKEFNVPAGHYFVLGDNRNHSNDSRHWFTPADEKPSPYVNVKDISGKVKIVLWPINKIRLIPSGMSDT